MTYVSSLKLHSKEYLKHFNQPGNAVNLRFRKLKLFKKDLLGTAF